MTVIKKEVKNGTELRESQDRREDKRPEEQEGSDAAGAGGPGGADEGIYIPAGKRSGGAFCSDTARSDRVPGNDSV